MKPLFFTITGPDWLPCLHHPQPSSLSAQIALAGQRFRLLVVLGRKTFL